MTNVSAPDFVYQLTDGTSAFGSQVLSDLQSLRTYLNTAQLGSATLSDVDAHLASSSVVFRTGDLRWTFREILVDEAGWLLANGRTSLSVVTYADLFALLGTKYGGDGITTFGIPDLQCRMVIGQDTMGGAAATNRVTLAGSGVNALTVGAVGGSQLLQSHTHLYDRVAGTFPGLTDGGHVLETIASITNIATSSAGGGSSQNMPPVIVAQALIKT